jgi:hypothetical protein
MQYSCTGVIVRRRRHPCIDGEAHWRVSPLGSATLDISGVCVWLASARGPSYRSPAFPQNVSYLPPTGTTRSTRTSNL